MSEIICFCRNDKNFSTTNEFELKTRDINFFYNMWNIKSQDRKTCSDVQPSKHKEHNNFTRELNWENPSAAFH